MKNVDANASRTRTIPIIGNRWRYCGGVVHAIYGTTEKLQESGVPVIRNEQVGFL